MRAEGALAGDQKRLGVLCEHQARHGGFVRLGRVFREVLRQEHLFADISLRVKVAGDQLAA